MSTATASDVKRISLWDSLDGEWIKLPCECMRECGPAAQTLGGFLRLTRRETYASVGHIASLARLPEKTVKTHLATLTKHGWITHDGRQPTRSGRPRRTVTRRATAKALTAAKTDYGFLPWWAGCPISKWGHLRWRERAVLSVVMARLCSLRGAIQQQEMEDDITTLEDLGGAERFRLPLRTLEYMTGLCRHSAIAAKRRLASLGIIELLASNDDSGGDSADILEPRADFCVVITPAGEGRCHVAFGRV